MPVFGREPGLAARECPVCLSRRRALGLLAGGTAALAMRPAMGAAAGQLRVAPVELAGDWGAMVPGAARLVLERMRAACLDGVRLVSDRQPERLRVEEHHSGPPAVWLHAEPARTAWVIVDIGERAWSQLAYQFGHELGHVTANSWQPDAHPARPCQWLEEALVEAFSLRGLAALAAGWKRAPPFAGDGGYGDSILGYRQNVLRQYAALAAEQGLLADPAGWLVAQRAALDRQDGLGPLAQAASLLVLAQYDRDPGCVEALGALNRWPERSALSLDAYLRAWERSCGEVGASAALVRGLRGVFGV